MKNTFTRLTSISVSLIILWAVFIFIDTKVLAASSYDGIYEYSNQIKVKEATNLTVISAGYASINLRWKGELNASGVYEIYRSTSIEGKYSLVATTKSQTFTDNNLKTGTVYYYKIRVCNLNKATKLFSKFTNVKSSKPVPSVPQNFKVIRISKNSVSLTWKSVAGASGYEIYRFESANGKYNLLNTSTNLYFKDSTLVSGKNYYYKIRAYTLVGKNKVYGDKTQKINITEGKVYFDGKYTDVGWINATQYCQTITMDNKTKRFTFRVNLYEGMGTLKGTYKLNGNEAICTVTESNCWKSVKSFVLHKINDNSFVMTNIDKPDYGVRYFVFTKETSGSKSEWSTAYINFISKSLKKDNGLEIGLYDVDKDKIPELFVSEIDKALTFTIGVYTYKNGKVDGLGKIVGYPYICEKPDSIFGYLNSRNIWGGGSIYKLKAGKLVETSETVGYCYSYIDKDMDYSINGKEVTEDKYKAIIEKYSDSFNKIAFVEYYYAINTGDLKFFETKKLEL